MSNTPSNPQGPNPEPDDTSLDVTSDLNDPSSPPMSQFSQASHAVFGGGAAPASPTGELFQLGRYALLGSPDGKSRKPVAGGEGQVFLAQAIAGGPKVALKTPLPQYADHPRRCARLVQEAKHLQSMKHPAIVQVYDIDEHHQPPYYTMTCLPNGSLADRLVDDQPMPLEEVLRLTIPLADAVKYVHEKKGVSHRDIKPQNVMMDEYDRPVFVDFGLSRDNTGDQATIVDPSHDTSSSRFKVGTLLYMAPELFEGKAGNSQTDIYAFGVMLYVMATGKRPYDGRDFDSLSAQKRLSGPIEPIAAHPNIDPRLSRVILHATARRAKDRYATMEDLLEDLQAIQEGRDPLHAPVRSTKPIVDEPETTSGPESTPAKRSRAPMLTAVALLLLAALAGGGYVVYDQVIKPGQEGAGDALASSLFGDDSAAIQYTDPADPAPTDGTPADPSEPAATLADATPPAVSDDPGNAETSNPLSQSSQPPSSSTASMNDAPATDAIPSLFDDDMEPAEPLANQESASAVAPTETVTIHATFPPEPTPAQLDEVIAQVNARLDGDPALDAKAVAAMGRLLQLTEEDARTPWRGAYTTWVHEAAKHGATQSLAWLLQHSADFDVAGQAELDSGNHWLQTAIRSPENRAFAQNFSQWMQDNQIDASILTAAAIGTKAPLKMAQDLGRQEWVDALQQAATDLNHPLSN